MLKVGSGLGMKLEHINVTKESLNSIHCVVRNFNFHYILWIDARIEVSKVIRQLPCIQGQKFCAHETIARPSSENVIVLVVAYLVTILLALPMSI